MYRPRVPSAQPTTYFLKKAAGLTKGTSNPGKEFVGEVTLKQIYAIALIKHTDPNLKRCSLESVCKQIAGSCTTLGLRVLWDEGRQTPDDPVP